MELRPPRGSVRVPSLRGRRRREIERELASHLEDACRDLERAGMSPDEATRQSLIRFGDPGEIADGFARVYRPRLSARLAVACGLAASVFVGAYSSGAFASGATSHRAHAVAHHVRIATPVRARP